MNFLLFNYGLGINFSSNEIIKPNTMGGKKGKAFNSCMAFLKF